MRDLPPAGIAKRRETTRILALADLEMGIIDPP
jgi:hypothetical protein